MKELNNEMSNHANKVKEWNNFLQAVENLDDKDLKKQGMENQRMVWSDNKADYKDAQLTDSSVLDTVNYEIGVANYFLRNGKTAVKKQILEEISKLDFKISALKKHLKL